MIVPNGGIDETVPPQKIELGKWTAASNVEPMFDGVRSRRGCAQQNSTIIPSISVSYEGGTDTEVFTDGVDEYISQGFTTVAAITCKTVSVRMKLNAGSPTGNITCAIYDDSSGEPGTVVTGLDTTDFSTVDSSTVDGDFRWYRFTVSSSVALSDATVYHIVIAHTGTVAGNTILLEESASGNGYAGGRKNYSTDGSTWVADTNADLNFRVYDDTTGATITGIADYRLSDASTSRFLVIAGGEVYNLSSGTMTCVSGWKRTVLDDTATVYPSHTVGSDRWFVTDNSSVGQKFYVLSGTEYWENEGIAAPTTTPTASNTASGDPVSPAGQYYIDYYWWNDDLGIASDRRYGGVDTLTATTSSEQISLSNLPAAPEREGDRATHLRIEIKEPSSSVYRLVKEIAVGTTSTTINGSDQPTTVEAEYEHAVSPVHRLKLVAENRQFIGDIVASGVSRPYRLMYSEIIGTTPYYESFPAFNFRDFGRGDGDYMTARAFMYPQTLIVGFRNSIYAIDARRPGTSDVVTISKRVGIAHHLAVQVVNQRMYFLSDSADQVGCYVWSPGQGEPKLLSGIDGTLKGLDASRFQYASTAIYAPGDNRFQWWVLLTDSGTQHDTVLVYDYALNAWTRYDLPSGKEMNVLGNVETSNAGRVYSGDYDGGVHLRDSGTTDDGTSYTSSLSMGWIGFGSDNIKKRLRWVDYVADNSQSGTVLLSIDRDYDTRRAASVSLEIAPVTGGITWGDVGSIWGTSRYSQSGDTKIRSAIRGVAEIFKPNLYSEDVWHLKGISFAIQPIRRR